LTVVSEIKPGGVSNDVDRARLASTVASRIKDLVGVTATVQLVSPGTIERSGGKAKRVVDLRH
jgi:phenylacetate-CoA ligase